MRRIGFLALAMFALFPVVRAEGESLYPDLQDRSVSPGKRTYFIDPQAGDDANAGTSETSPWKTFLPVGQVTLSSGDRLKVRPGSFRHSLSLSAQGSREEPVEVHFRFIHGMGIVNQFSENLTFDGIRIAPDSASGRTTAAWADCIQASGCRGRIVVDDCVFSGAHDDAINIHGTYLRVVAWKPEQRELLVRFMQKQSYGFPAFHAGDEVAFVRWDSLASYGDNRVAKAEMIDPWNMRLELEKPLPDTIRENDVLENVTWTPEVEIRGCEVRHIPTRGFLCSTRRQVVIEDNDFFATHMSGVLIGIDASSWFESGCVMDMTIRGNRFHQCGEPVIQIDLRNSIANPEVHRNIRIVGNTFDLKGRLAVGGHGTDGLLVSGNSLRADPLPEAESWLDFKDCGRIVVRDNQVEKR